MTPAFPIGDKWSMWNEVCYEQTHIMSIYSSVIQPFKGLMWLNVKVKRVVKDMRKIFLTFKNISQRAVWRRALFGLSKHTSIYCKQSYSYKLEVLCCHFENKECAYKKKILRTNTFSCYLPNCAKCVSLFK